MLEFKTYIITASGHRSVIGIQAGVEYSVDLGVVRQTRLLCSGRSALEQEGTLAGGNNRRALDNGQGREGLEWQGGVAGVEAGDELRG